MQGFDEAVLISAPFGRAHEAVASARYRWRCDGRGREPFVIVQHTLEGAGRFARDGADPVAVPAGFAFVAVTPEPAGYDFPPGARGPWVFRWINFYGPMAVELWRRFRAAVGPVAPLGLETPAAHILLALARKAETRRAGDRWETSAEAFAFLMAWRAELARPAGPAPDPVAAAVRHCETRYRDPVTVKELAAAAGLSREHFTRRFREAMGVGPAAFLRGRRLAAARELLGRGRLPQAEVALRCGFGSARQLRRLLAHGAGETRKRRAAY